MTDNFSDGRYSADTKEAILDALLSDAQSTGGFDQELDEDEVAIVRSFYDPIAEQLADIQDDVALVMDSAWVDYATGTALELKGALVGVPISGSEAATGRVRMSRDSVATTDYSVPAGTIVQTDEVDPEQFTLDNGVTLGVLDDFEDQDLVEYTGDTGDASINTTTVHEGDASLELAATSGAQIHRTAPVFGPGSKIHVRVYANTNTIPIFRFGLTDKDNCYQVRIDTSAGSLELELVDGGSTSDLDTTSVSIPNGEWLDLVIDWKINGDIDVDLDDSGGSDVATVSTTDETTYVDNLGFGFMSGDANATKLFDFVSMTAVGADVTAEDEGTGGNVGPESLVVFPDEPSGIESITNPLSTSGGEDKEPEEDYRARIKSEIGGGARGTQKGLIEQLESMSEVKSVTVIENDSSTTDGDGRPDHSVEPIVQVDSAHYDDVAQTIADTKGTGYPSVGGYGGTSQSGTAEFTNGQTKTIDFSTPTEVQIYADIDVQVDGTYVGDSGLRDNVVRYIGGTLAAGGSEDGDLEVSDNVIYYKVVEAVSATEGVVDITNLEIGTSSDPSGTSNITISDTDIATADASDSSLNVSSTVV